MGPGVRREDWEARLEAELRKDAPFVWGLRDCCLFAADCVRAMTGADPAAEYRGRYNSEHESSALVPAGIEAAIDRALGQRIPPRKAQRGDVVMVPTRHGDMAGVVALDGRVALLLPAGLRRVPLSLATSAWRV